MSFVLLDVYEFTRNHNHPFKSERMVHSRKYRKCAVVPAKIFGFSLDLDDGYLKATYFPLNVKMGQEKL